MEPAQSIINLCGGYAAVAAMVARSEIRIRRWTYPKDRGGTGGMIPTDMQKPLIEAAQAKGIALTPDHILYGVPAAQRQGAA